MERTQSLIIALLIVAIMFSLVSVAMNLSLGEFRQIASESQSAEKEPNGNINLFIEENNGSRGVNENK